MVPTTNPLAPSPDPHRRITTVQVSHTPTHSAMARESNRHDRVTPHRPIKIRSRYPHHPRSKNPLADTKSRNPRDLRQGEGEGEPISLPQAALQDRRASPPSFCISVVVRATLPPLHPRLLQQAIAPPPLLPAVFAFAPAPAAGSRRWSTWLPPPVVLGIVLASNSEPLFHSSLLVCLCSTAGEALKSASRGSSWRPSREAQLHDSADVHGAHRAAILLPLSFYIEGNVAAVTLDKAAGDPRLLWLLFGNATVLGNAKAAVAAVVSVLIFKNPVNVMGIVGFGVTIFGVVLYSEAKKRTNSSNSPSNPNSNASGSAAS
ncbi:uncharacterized protein A4U43_C01F12440 [Asparagus officinalis]|uniref:Sugar phosphate transporter domain-containing protein n=1 Tax=Asparagus officinalis TaxID=4686 RepID=A0A5P1FNT5_ASPOF|nr:uncharacterized protein A4U43_C01F12440 [Asparagus officinalis]